MENKQYRIVKAEIKADGIEGNIGRIKGYGSVFGVLDSYDDIVEKGSFVKSINEKMPKMLLQHSWSEVAGVWTIAREDDKGLHLEGEINLDVQRAKEYYSLIKQGAIDGLSIGYITTNSDTNSKTGVRHIKEVDLMEVSIVTFPANRAALIREIRSAQGFQLPTTERQFEDFLRDAGYSRTQAKIIAAKGFKAPEDQRDVDVDVEIAASLKTLVSTLTGVKNV